ncbi:putative 26S proteasome complex subunit sem-1 [Drechslerella stenobrocha 248]|uniref:26S proteasome complex subunit SEM1 n=1 Tax=Drechslerella stenobrocha 248 TaxID=1043628 RepID=W7I8F2_9PEZI|nr:putative 26S proteasome complex subunit sem-1 [Drechslerella stenobrocha 248]
MSSKDAAKSAAPKPEETKDPKTVKKILEEDDEFEDFPAEEWEEDETEVPPGSGKPNLWEESWDDDDTSDDFSKQLREELKKVDAQKASGEMQR